MKSIKTLLIQSIFILTIVSAGLLIGACSSEETQQESTVETQQMEMNESGEQVQLYTCPMHPDVVSDEPGECPECGMDLVAAETDGMQHENHTGQDSEMEHDH
jgi:hypothetical protein